MSWWNRSTCSKLALSVTEYTIRNPSPVRMYCSRMALNSSCPAVSSTKNEREDKKEVACHSISNWHWIHKIREQEVNTQYPSLTATSLSLYPPLSPGLGGSEVYFPSKHQAAVVARSRRESSAICSSDQLCLNHILICDLPPGSFCSSRGKKPMTRRLSRHQFR